METCPCGSNLVYDSCCKPLIKGEKQAANPEQVMRSRYTAYVKKEIDYLLTSLHPEHRSDFDARSTRAWAENAEWHGLEIRETTGGGPDDSRGVVEFVASFSEKGIRKDHHEAATFIKQEGTWYFENGEAVRPKQVVRSEPKTGRNDPCPCRSGKKYKKCCGIE